MPLLTPLYMGDDTNPVFYTAQQDRAGLLSSIFSREGVIDTLSGQLKVAQRAAGANFTVEVAAGRCAIYGDDISDQGTYVCASTTTVNVTVPPKPASGTLTHRIIARVRDKLANGVWTTTDWTIELLADTGTGLKATPNSAISLATIAVSSTATSVTDAMITDTRPVAMVGTPDTAGTWTLNTANWQATDPARALTYRVNAQGWVSLAGFVSRVSGAFTYQANAQYLETSTPLPVPIRPVGAGRDFMSMTSVGPVHWLVGTDGSLRSRFHVQTTVPASGGWMSLDGAGYRITN